MMLHEVEKRFIMMLHEVEKRSEAIHGRWHEMSNGLLSPEHIQQRVK
jgi:hypothetical protein